MLYIIHHLTKNDPNLNIISPIHFITYTLQYELNKHNIESQVIYYNEIDNYNFTNKDKLLIYLTYLDKIRKKKIFNNYMNNIISKNKCIFYNAEPFLYKIWSCIYDIICNNNIITLDYSTYHIKQTKLPHHIYTPICYTQYLEDFYNKYKIDNNDEKIFDVLFY